MSRNGQPGARHGVRRRLELPPPDAAGGRGQAGPGAFQTCGVRHDRPDRVAGQEVQLDRGRQVTRLRLVGQRVQRQLEGVTRALPGAAQVRHVARLVVGDDRPGGPVVHPVVPAAQAVATERDAEGRLDGRRVAGRRWPGDRRGTGAARPGRRRSAPPRARATGSPPTASAWRRPRAASPRRAARPRRSLRWYAATAACSAEPTTRA